jgi:hypothetical protein
MFAGILDCIKLSSVPPEGPLLPSSRITAVSVTQVHVLTGFIQINVLELVLKY